MRAAIVETWSGRVLYKSEEIISSVSACERFGVEVMGVRRRMSSVSSGGRSSSTAWVGCNGFPMVGVLLTVLVRGKVAKLVLSSCVLKTSCWSSLNF